MTVRNLTPHAINIIGENNEVLATFEPSGIIARAAQSKELVEELSVNGMTIPVYESAFGKVENLPEPEEGTIFVVSALTAQACKGRTDIYITDNPVRDGEGRIIGCRSLGKI